MKGATRLRELLRQPGLIMAPGAHDVMSARLVEAEGFPVVYLGGYAWSASALGIPDHSLITTTELLAFAARVAAVVQIPILMDMDDAGGTPLNVRRTIRLCEQAGLAGVHIEDLAVGKHFSGHKDRLIPQEEAAERIRAAVEARTDPDFVVIARTDALSVTSLDDALDRARAYAAAGADLLFLPYLGLAQAPAVVQALPLPLLGIVGDATRAEVEQSGFKIAIYPGHALYVTYKAVRDLYHDLKEHGTIPNFRDRIYRRAEFEEFIGVGEATQLAERYHMV